MSHETRHALASLMRSDDTNDALDEIARMIGEVDALDLSLDLDDENRLDLDLDLIDARAIDVIYYFDVSACESLDDLIDNLDR